MKIDGFSFSAIEAGVRYKDRLDLGLIYSDSPCVTAGVYTKSLVKAAPLVIDQKRIKTGMAQAILVNSGCANACTGDLGLETAMKTGSLVATELGIADELVQLSSTGVIGEQLNLSAFEGGTKKLVANLSPDSFLEVAKAIMTTDTVHKVARTQVVIDGRQVTIIGMTKGAGMIMPNMATMLAFVMTDADIDHQELQQALSFEVERTFNRITIDGDTSTNDMVLVMANKKAGNKPIDATTPGNLTLFQEGLGLLLKDLALQIVQDGEGATKTITIKVIGAGSDGDAEKIARTVATSSLVKTAFFGEDANWGRIFGAMGRAGVYFKPEIAALHFGDVQLVENGMLVNTEAEVKASKVLKQKEIDLLIDLKMGKGEAEIYTCDFSIDYVKINADYRS